MTKKPRAETPDATRLNNILAGLDKVSLAILMEVRRNPGLSMVKIADRLSIDRHTVSKLMHELRFRRALAEITIRARSLVDRYAPDAARLLGRQLSIDNEKVAQGAARILLRHHLGLDLNIGEQDPELPPDMNEQDADDMLEEFKKALKSKRARKKKKA